MENGRDEQDLIASLSADGLSSIRPITMKRRWARQTRAVLWSPFLPHIWVVQSGLS